MTNPGEGSEAGPIGIFDSGVGGLSVAREIRAALPAEDILYVADTAYCPYGDRPLEEVRARALAVGRYIQESGAKLLVAACNTASGAALEDLRGALSIPVVGLEPAVKTAVAQTRVGRVGVMATSGTLRSERFARLLRAHGDGIQVIAQACPGLADLIEEGHLDGDVLGAALQELTRPLRDAAVDMVVLGCTHYAFVGGPMQRVLGTAVTLVAAAHKLLFSDDIACSVSPLLSMSGPEHIPTDATACPFNICLRRFRWDVVTTDSRTHLAPSAQPRLLR